MLKSKSKLSMLVIFALLFFVPIQGSVDAQGKNSQAKQILNLKQLIKELTDKQKMLEARVRELERRNPDMSPKALQQRQIDANKEGILADLNNLASYIYQYLLRPVVSGGGSGTYFGFVLPLRLTETQEAVYSTFVNRSTVTIKAKSILNYGEIIAVLDSTGHLGMFTYTGDLQ